MTSVMLRMAATMLGLRLTRVGMFLGALCVATSAMAAPTKVAVPACDPAWSGLALSDGGMFSQYLRAWTMLQSTDSPKGLFVASPGGPKKLVVTRGPGNIPEMWLFNRTSGEPVVTQLDRAPSKDEILVTCSQPDSEVVDWKAVAPDIAARTNLQCQLKLKEEGGPQAVDKWVLLAVAVTSDGGNTTILAALDGRGGKVTRCKLSK